MSTTEVPKLELAELLPDEPSQEPPQETSSPEDKPTEAASEQPASEIEPAEPSPQQLQAREEEPSKPEPTKERSPTPEAAKQSKGSGKASMDISIALLGDGEDLELNDRDRKEKASVVIDEAHKKQDTAERDFFSLSYYDEYTVSSKGNEQEIHLQQKIFINPLRPLKPQLYPPEKQNNPVKLVYGVKYYVPDPAKLREDYSRYLYCVQLCDDIRRNRVRVDRETAIRLTALMLQATLDDYDADLHKEGYTKKFPNFELLPPQLQPDNYEAQVIAVHKAKVGYTPAQAESEFLSLAKDLPRYGEHLFLAKDVEGNPVMIGNGCKGVSIYKDYGENKERKLIEWKDIVKISYKKHKFRVKYYPEGEEENANERRRIEYTKFYTGDPPQAKRIWKNAVEQHAFFRLSEPEAPTLFERLARRSSFRFSGNTLRQSMRVKPQRDHHDFDRRTMSMRAVKKRNFKVKDHYVIEERPPAGNAIDLEKFERQRVVVDFHLADSAEDQAQRYVLRKDQRGSYQMLDAIDFDEGQQKDYHLSEVDEESKAALVSVILNVEAPSGSAVSHIHNHHGNQPVFDSKRMPIVKLGGAALVETGSEVVSEGRPVTSGRHKQSYPLKGTYDYLGPTEGVGPAVDGSEEAKQVDLFLKREGDLMKMAEESVREANGEGTGEEAGQLEEGEGPSEEGAGPIDEKAEEKEVLPPEVEIEVVTDN